MNKFKEQIEEDYATLPLAKDAADQSGWLGWEEVNRYVWLVAIFNLKANDPQRFRYDDDHRDGMTLRQSIRRDTA